MSWTLNNVESKNNYEAATTIETGKAKRANVSVYNAAVLVQLLTDPVGKIKAQAQWQPPLFVAPGSIAFARNGLFGVRFKSAVSGKPAQVTVELLAVGD